MTVVETEQFLREADVLLTDSERTKLVTFVAWNPEAGDVVPETGGVRKLRWAMAGKGKRGGARVIYYFHSELLPVFMLDIYAKNVKGDLTKSERNAIKKRIPILVERYRDRRST